MFIPVQPVAKPRMTRSDKWKQRPCVMKYRKFSDDINNAYRGELPEKVRIQFNMPMVSNWSDKKKEAMEGQPHQKRPDIDNMIKAVLDALCKEDAHIYDVHATKLYSNRVGIIIDEMV